LEDFGTLVCFDHPAASPRPRRDRQRARGRGRASPEHGRAPRGRARPQRPAPGGAHPDGAGDRRALLQAHRTDVQRRDV